MLRPGRATGDDHLPELLAEPFPKSRISRNGVDVRGDEVEQLPLVDREVMAEVEGLVKVEGHLAHAAAIPESRPEVSSLGG